MSEAIELTNDMFESEVTESDIPVLVDFWAEWCGPCRMLGPVVDQLAAEFEGQVKVMKVNVDSEPEIAQQFGILSIPTLILFRDGEPVSKAIGLRTKDDLSHMLSEALTEN